MKRILSTSVLLSLHVTGLLTVPIRTFLESTMVNGRILLPLAVLLLDGHENTKCSYVKLMLERSLTTQFH